MKLSRQLVIAKRDSRCSTWKNHAHPVDLIPATIPDGQFVLTRIGKKLGEPRWRLTRQPILSNAASTRFA